ncbi:hypothetical protein [Streptomyces sp. NPDC002825]|uniref:hypothetical protein n=1 Tax=Streptomyces sp. NPDC002825 TaxID=3154666 RepID=UPI0033254912
MSTDRVIHKAAALAAATVAMGGLVLGTAGPAAAYDNDGRIESGEFGFYYNSDEKGCVFDVYVYDNNFADNSFKDPSSINCAGEGQSTNDNTASYWNRWTGYCYVWTDSYRGGIRGSLPGGYTGNASATFKNQISSTADTV